IKNERREEAEDAWRTAIKYDPNKEAPWLNLSVNMSTSGRCDEAKEALTRAQELAPNDEYVIRAEMLWKTLCGGGSNTDVSVETVSMDSENLEFMKIMNKGYVLVDHGQLQEAEECYLRAIDLNKSEPIAWGMLGTVLRGQDRLVEAENAFEEAIKLSKPMPPSIIVNYSILLKQLGKEDEAERALIQLTKEHPDFAIGWFNLGNLYLKKRDWTQAEEMYCTTLDQNPEPRLMVKVKWNLGVTLKEMNEYEKAEISLLEALEIDPMNRDIKNVLEEVRALQRKDLNLDSSLRSFNITITGPPELTGPDGKMSFRLSDTDVEYGKQLVKKAQGSNCPHCSVEIAISGIIKPDGSVICPKCFKKFKPGNL
ncbi:MAG: tetratricopeptide repeat protein, partial [Candidatus Thorarchaeota archaeon]